MLAPRGNGGRRVKMTQRLRALLKQGKTLFVPGCYNPTMISKEVNLSEP